MLTTARQWNFGLGASLHDVYLNPGDSTGVMGRVNNGYWAMINGRITSSVPLLSHAHFVNSNRTGWRDALVIRH